MSGAAARTGDLRKLISVKKNINGKIRWIRKHKSRNNIVYHRNIKYNRHIGG